jgi:hypothetical protein
MKEYSNIISLTKNSRGIYCMDTSIGCESGMLNEPGGCYNDCYSANAAKRYGYDFSKTVLRYFKDEYHRRDILNKINRAKLDFIRIGCSGDPSEDWEHTINIIKKIDKCNKQIVIITRHWTLLTNEQLEYFNTINICINTSISALDKPDILQNCLTQFKRIKPYCKSILRIVSCDFNLQNSKGKILSEMQKELFKNVSILDTVFRPNKNNQLIIEGIINTTKGMFMNKPAILSKFNQKTFTGKCANCHEMCGVEMNKDNYKNKIPITKQLTIFKQARHV